MKTKGKSPSLFYSTVLGFIHDKDHLKSLKSAEDSDAAQLPVCLVDSKHVYNH